MHVFLCNIIFLNFLNFQLTIQIQTSKIILVCDSRYAIVVQLVAHDLAKVELAGSSPVYRSEKMLRGSAFFYADIQRR